MLENMNNTIELDKEGLFKKKKNGYFIWKAHLHRLDYLISFNKLIRH